MSSAVGTMKEANKNSRFEIAGMVDSMLCFGGIDIAFRLKGQECCVTVCVDRIVPFFPGSDGPHSCSQEQIIKRLGFEIGEKTSFPGDPINKDGPVINVDSKDELLALLERAFGS